MKNRGNREERFVWQGAIYSVHGDGITPGFPLSEAGAVHQIKMDVEVPAVVAGNPADWHASYPGQYGAASFDLDLIQYVGPIDATGKLHAKGNLHIVKVLVMMGVTVCGAAAPTQAGGQTEIMIENSHGVGTHAWYYLNTMPSSTGPITPTSRTEDFIIGADEGLSQRLTMRVNAITNNIVAGRWRVVLYVAEV